MSIPYIRGKVASQAHVGVPDGTYEEEYARDGFFGRYAHLYRAHAPVGWSRIEGPLRPRAYDTEKLEPRARSAGWLGHRTPLLSNDDVRISMAVVSEPMPSLFRNADADEVFFIHAGAGRLETDFGPLSYEPGDYLLIPRGTVYRFAPTSPTRALLVEAYSEVTWPDRGLLGQHALFDPAVIQVPTPEASTLAADAGLEWAIEVLRLGEVTRVYYPFNPLDVVGWKGTLTVQKLRVRDIRPISSDRYHLPPSAHSTLVMRNAVICSFVPRPLENGDPLALKVPFFHSNIDFDEVLFYHSGDFFSRSGITPGMITFHPQGIHHGPHPKAAARTSQAQRTEEIAIMIDTKRPLRTADEAQRIETPEYWSSWK